MRGYNGTILAYGQTSCGKTYTMEGPSIDDEEKKGIIPRMVNVIFDAVMDADDAIEFSIAVSYVEIYMEKIRDLLDPARANLSIQMDKSGGGGTYVDASELYVGSPEDVMQCMRRGSVNRTTQATRMNEESSRSHSIFIVTVVQKNRRNGAELRGKLYLVDLAGSEKVSKTHAEGQAMEEAKQINKSLSCLGQVINHLTDGKSTHIPYRDSKLTRLLSESLGGNSKTCLMLNCSISSYNEEETVSTLRFGQRAKKIKNQAIVNLEYSAEELRRMIDQLNKELVLEKARVADLEAGGAQDEGGATPGEHREGVQELLALKEELTEQNQELQDEVEMLQEVQDELLESLQQKEIEDKSADDIMQLRADADLMLESLAELKFDNEKKDLMIEDLARKLAYTEEELSRLTLEKPQSAEEMKHLAKLDDMKISTPTGKSAAQEAKLKSLEQYNARCEQWILAQSAAGGQVLEQLRSQLDDLETEGRSVQKEDAAMTVVVRTLEDKVEEQAMLMSDQAAQFEQWKNVIKQELEQKCARIVAIETELNEEKENNKLMMSSGTVSYTHLTLPTKRIV
eukprot:TRINITY_DN6935_c0_g2_i1.p1 TRINITY_DN6935_c0_g2~~TRINITY_DN6935_c0_g2_i1.p1  ORF type:complete len:569 (-),score=207.55 TRINITY_DN6935_c0_g2_i1:119-1825(-)